MSCVFYLPYGTGMAIEIQPAALTLAEAIAQSLQLLISPTTTPQDSSFSFQQPGRISRRFQHRMELQLISSILHAKPALLPV